MVTGFLFSYTGVDTSALLCLCLCPVLCLCVFQEFPEKTRPANFKHPLFQCDDMAPSSSVPTSGEPLSLTYTSNSHTLTAGGAEMIKTNYIEVSPMNT